MFGYVNFARRCIRSVDAYASTRSHSFPFVSRRLGGFWLFGRSWCRWLVSGSLVLGVLGPLGWVARWFGWWSPGRARFPLVGLRVLGSWGARFPGSPSVASK